MQNDLIYDYPPSLLNSCAFKSSRFTGKESDSESGLDYFGARYYASSMGRFMSPDPENFGANIMNPQSWNMYSYAGNNPLINIDPDGRECVWDDGSYDSKDDPDSGSADKCSGLGGTWISNDIFENSQYYRDDWSGSANDALSGLVGNIRRLAEGRLPV